MAIKGPGPHLGDAKAAELLSVPTYGDSQAAPTVNLNREWKERHDTSNGAFHEAG
ncbi:hypothetical protein LEMLEM_LOCUS14338 [Lemmus lemmus]